MPKFCRQCGSPLEEGERFCPECGTPVAQAPQPEAQKPQRPGVDWSQFKPKITVGKPRVTFISKGKLIGVAVVLVILIILGLFSK